MPSAASMMQLWHTARHLRAGQIVGQARLRLRRLLEIPQRRPARAVPPWPGCRWRPVLDFLPPGVQQNSAGDTLRGRLRFLNDQQPLGWPPAWNASRPCKLWQYNLHYFEYLWPLEFPQAKTLVLDWIEKHPLRKGHLGWEPYPSSLRLVNLCCVFFGRYRRETEDDTAFCHALWKSIFLQAEWLGGHLEHHLMGNHLLENAAALVLAGCCFRGPGARRWFRRGMAILRQQIAEQILPDGGHFERSPMYHSRTLYVLLVLLASGDAQARELISPVLERMLDALRVMCHPDGQLALLNDSALGVYNEPRELLEYGRRLLGTAAPPEPPPGGTFALPETGYYGANSEQGDYVIVDAGPLGPDYLPGHAHGDIFSFELSLAGQRVIVDSGVYGYEQDSLRQYCRSTRAHNTVELDGQDQCEFWAVFRVARRGRPHQVCWRPFDGGFRLCGWHDGYRRLKGAATHRREFTWHHGGVLMVRDTVTSSRALAAVSRLHLHPECVILSLEDKTAKVGFAGGQFEVCFAGNGQLLAERAFYCPRFGVATENDVLEFRTFGKQSIAGFCLIDGAAGGSLNLTSGAKVDGREFAW